MPASMRSCIVPRPGYVFAVCDYPALELHTWAECCSAWLGFSAMAAALNEGKDPHSMMAGTMLGIPYEEAIRRKDANDPHFKKEREAAKPGNFGFPVGMGTERFVEYARANYGVTITQERAAEAKYAWKTTWPEAEGWLNFINSLVEQGGGLASICHYKTNRWRGGLKFTEAANSPFQGLGADIATRALWLVTRACWHPASLLYGCRVVNFVHDEIVAEARDGEQALEIARLMNVAADEFLMHVRMRPVDALLSSVWSKRAKQIKDENGRLVVWHPT